MQLLLVFVFASFVFGNCKAHFAESDGRILEDDEDRFLGVDAEDGHEDEDPPLPPRALPLQNEVLPEGSAGCSPPCGRWRECRAAADSGAAACGCQSRCRRRRKPVCGSDGRLYANHCELHREACRTRSPLSVDHRRLCLLPRPAASAPADDSSQTTTEEASADDVSSTTERGPEDPLAQPRTEGPTEESSAPQRECTRQEYEVMKENLLLFNNAKLTDSKKPGPEYLASVMFSHYDRGGDGRLEAEELWRAAERDHLGGLSPASACILADMLLFDDADRDGSLSPEEFYLAFSVSVVSLDKTLEVNHVTARVGDNVEIKCDVTGTPPPPIVWRRNDMDLAALNEDEIKVFVDGSLYLTNVQLIHGGNYTCHAQHNRDVVQTHVLHVHTIPEVHVIPKLQSRAPGELAEMECHVIGVPAPSVTWLKNDEELKPASDKYTVVGNGTALLVGKITYSDTGAYMCVASNLAGTTRDITSLIVQDQPTPTAASEERRFFAFHDWGVSVFDPDNCRLYHQIQSTDVIPGTQEYVCGDRGTNCSWGRAVDVGGRYVYASQPARDRLLVISRVQMAVVDVVVTDKVPVALHYVPHLDQVWVVCWRGRRGDRGAKTIQIIRDASQKKKHHTVHPEPVDGHFDLVSGLFVPPSQDLGHGWKYGYVTHSNQRGLYKLDLQAMKYIKTVDLTPYNCAPASADFATLGGYAILECREPVTGRPTGQLVLDYLTDTVVAHKSALYGSPRVSPDSRHVVTLQRANDSVTIVAQQITEDGLRFLFDVKTTLSVGELAFFPSRTTHSYDLYAGSASREDLLFVDLADGRVEMITGVGRPAAEGAARWGNPGRPLASAGVFGTYVVTAAEGALFVVNGKTRTVNCEIGSAAHPRLLVWARAP